jgi:RHS repeat-associated protein
MAIYHKGQNGLIRLNEHPVYGLARLGVYYRTVGKYAYQLTDHLGNVRAVVVDAGGVAVSVTGKTDYYPFGMPMPGRNVDGGYRYAFQDQEKDGETGMEAFELRLWDGRIGRWLTVDPMGEFYSPYLGMGNNPISLIDPTGGCTDCPDPIQLAEVIVTASTGPLWQPLTKSFLFDFTKMNFGRGLTDAQIHNMVGRKFEDAWNRYAIKRLVTNNYRPNNRPFFSKTRGRNVIPDGLADFTRSEYKRNKWGIPKVWEKPVNVRIRGGIWVEVKAKNGVIYTSTSSGQIAGHIDAMGQTPLVKKYGGQIILVTTSNVSISRSVKSAATKIHTKLQVAHVKAYGRIQNGNLQIQYHINPDIRDNVGYHNMGGYVTY